MIDYGILSTSLIAGAALYTWWSERRAHKKTEKFAEKMFDKVERLQAQLKEKSTRPPSGPYRDPASPEASSITPASRLYPYKDWTANSIDLECPMCGMKVHPKACSCTEHLEPHTHSECPECKFYFAMRGRRTSVEGEDGT